MKDKLVEFCIKILCLLPSEGLHLNGIFRQTGLAYKPDVVKAVRMLKKGGLIIEMSSPTHKQKKIQKLTELGIEIVKLITDIEQTNKSHSYLKILLIEKFGLPNDRDETALHGMLRSKGWNSKEIKLYYEFTRYALLLITESLIMIYYVLTYRYSQLSFKYDIKNVTRLILNKIILDALEYHISNSQDTRTLRQLYNMKDDTAIRITMDRLLSSIQMIEEHNPYLNRFTDAAGENLLSSICSVLEIPKNVVEDYISSIEDTLRAYQEEPLKDMGLEPLQTEPETYFINGMMFKNAHKEIRRISRRKMSILQKMMKRSS